MEEQNKDIMPEEPLQGEVLDIEPTQGQAEDTIYTAPDVYQAQTGLEVYNTPDTNMDSLATGGLFSGEQAEGSMGSGTYGVNQYAPVNYADNQNNNNGYGMNGSQYQYGNNGAVGGQNQFGNGGYGGNQYRYGNNGAGGGQYQYGNDGAGNNQYQYGNSGAGNSPYQYGNNGAGGNQYQYGNNGAGGNQYQYGNNAAGGNQYQYGNNAAGGNQYGNPYGYNQNGYNPYSPYAAPQKKSHTGLIIGIVISIAVIFLIALLAIIYNGFKSIYESRALAGGALAGSEDIGNDNDGRNNDNGGRNDDNSGRNNNDGRNNDDGGRDDNGGHGYGDKDDSDKDYDSDEYYTFHDDIKDGLSYSIKWEDYEYDTDNENVLIVVNYPVIVGDDVPNLDKINSTIAREATIFSEYYEDKYSKYTDNDEDSYFMVASEGYVTYMSESILSVVFHEKISSDYFGAVYLYCINIDMTAGVIMENTDIIDVDDDFSVDFRIRSDKQNGSSDALDSMSDQEITKLFKSSDGLIIFYTPQGMEIGVNYGDGYGWITVTYHDYKKYLKVF